MPKTTTRKSNYVDPRQAGRDRCEEIVRISKYSDIHISTIKSSLTYAAAELSNGGEIATSDFYINCAIGCAESLLHDLISLVKKEKKF